MTQEDLMNGATDGGMEADGVVRDAGNSDNNSGDSNTAGNIGAGAPAGDVAQPSQAELVRQFGDEFRRSMQAAIDRDGPEAFWKKVYDHMKKAMGNEW